MFSGFVRVENMTSCLKQILRLTTLVVIWFIVWSLISFSFSHLLGHLFCLKWSNQPLAPSLCLSLHPWSSLLHSVCRLTDCKTCSRTVFIIFKLIYLNEYQVYLIYGLIWRSVALTVRLFPLYWLCSLLSTVNWTFSMSETCRRGL